MKYLGIDYGTKKIGIALSDEEGNLAFPKCVLENNVALFENVMHIVLKEHVGVVVLGESLDYEGKDNPVMKEINGFKKTT